MARRGTPGSLPYMEFVAQQTARNQRSFGPSAAGGTEDCLGGPKGKIAYNYYAPDLYDRAAAC